MKFFPLRHCRNILFLAAALLTHAVSAAPPAKRIVSLTPATTEIICKLGAADRLVGRSAVCNYPEEIKKLPVAGDMANPFPEKVMMLNPDLIICDTAHPEANFAIFRRHDIRICRLPAQKLADYPANVRTIGSLLGVESAAEAEARRFEKFMIDLQKNTPVQGPKVLMVLGLDPVVTCGDNTFTSELIKAAGAENIAAGKRSGYFTLSAEFVAAAAPEVIIAADMPGIDRAISAIPGWHHLPAVKSRRIHTDLNADILFRLGPRITEGISLLHKLFFLKNPR